MTRDTIARTVASGSTWGPVRTTSRWTSAARWPTSATAVYSIETRHLRDAGLGGGSDGLAVGPEWIWPDTLAFDHEGAPWVSTNHLNHAFSGRMNFDQMAPNFRIMRVRLKEQDAWQSI